MRRVIRIGLGLLRDRKGAAVIEYGLIIGLIVLALMAALVELGTTTKGIWDNVSDKVQKTN
jgi:pilus assembly protein Flp/PilA